MQGATGAGAIVAHGTSSLVYSTGSAFRSISSARREARIDLSGANDEIAPTEAEANADSIYFYGSTLGDVTVLLDGIAVPDGHIWTAKNFTTNAVVLDRGGAQVALPVGAAVTAVNIGDD